MTTATALPDALGPAAREFLVGPHRLLIGAERPDSVNGRTFATLDPATGQEIAQVAHAGPEDVERAVSAAREAFEGGPWATLPAAGRGQLIEALAEKIEAHAEELVEIESLDNGKPVRSSPSLSMSPGTVAHLRYSRGVAEQDRG